MDYPKLSKSKIRTGMNCPKAIWLDKYKREEKRKFTKEELYRFGQGTRVGELAARTLFPTGVRVEGGWRKPIQAAQLTDDLIKSGENVLFEAAFVSDEGIVALLDIMQLIDENTIDFNEVKSSTKLKPEHIEDATIQKYVLENLGYNVNAVNVIHLNNKIIINDTKDLFITEEVTSQTVKILSDLPEIVKDLSSILEDSTEPTIQIGHHCHKPYECSFTNYCWKDVPDNSIFTVPRIHITKIQKLQTLGIISAEDIPDSFELTEIQRNYVNLVIGGKTQSNTDGIKTEMSKLEFPLYFLDFETYMVALPKIDTNIPYKHVPFQFSCHILDKDGNLDHKEYLHDGSNNTVSEEFINSLLKILKSEGSIISYNINFERMILRQLKKAFPVYEETIDGLISRFWDMEIMFKNHFHDPKFQGRSSLKVVLPVLISSMSYEDLDLSKGSEAGIYWEEMLDCDTEDERNEIKKILLQYCKTDTLAMVKLYELLLAM